MHERHGWYIQDAPAKVDGVCRLIEDSGLRPTSVLDIGCGSGDVLAGVSARLGVPGVGWDPDPRAVELAGKHSGIEVHLGDLEAAGWAELVLCLDVFEHVADDRAFLRELRAHGEWFAFRIPLDDSLWDRLRGRTARFAEDYGHLHAYTWGRAIRLLRETGYDPRVVRPHRIEGGRGDRIRRWTAAMAPRLATRTIGGFSLLVVAR